MIMMSANSMAPKAEFSRKKDEGDRERHEGKAVLNERAPRIPMSTSRSLGKAALPRAS
jgi:hypothetical protein